MSFLFRIHDLINLNWFQSITNMLLSCWVMSDFLWPHEMQHARLPFPSLSPGLCSNSCPVSQWCYITISSSATPFSFCLQSFPASGSFPMSWLFTSGGQSIGASASVLPMNEYSGLISFRIDWLVLFKKLNSYAVFPFIQFWSLLLSSHYRC